MTGDEFEARAGQLDSGLKLHPASYETVQPDGKPRWVAQGEVWDDRDVTKTIIHPIYPTPKTLYASKAEADSVALIAALQWAEQGLPPLPTPGESSDTIRS